MASTPRSALSRGSHGPRARGPWMVAGAVVLGLAVIAGSIQLGTWIGSQRSPASTASTAATATPAGTAPPTPTGPPPTPTGPPSAPAAPAPLAGFGAGPFAGGAPASGQLTSVDSVRAAAQSGYDRFVIDLGSSPLQRYEVRTQPTSQFTLDPKGEVITLNGSRGVQIVLSSASNHESFNGATDTRPGLSAIKEARVTSDYEGVVTWSLGVDGPGFVRVTTLDSPNRLVVDVQS